MSQAPSTSMSSSNFQSIFNAALKVYKKKTKKDLLAHPLTAQLQSCNSPADILLVLQDKVKELDQSRTMSPRPVRKIIPSAKLTADNAGNLELTSHCMAIASASVALTAPQLSRTPATSSPLPESSPPPPTDTEDASSPAPHLAQARTSSKRPLYATIKSHDSVITVSSTTSDDTSEIALMPPKLKRPKTSPIDREPEVHTDFSIIDIDDIEDPEDE
ncbi:hypothetical protein EDB83DRAFT_2523694 [Lactarius deliciosus]|nr:hypothetical protein EDB83DRAFT_2523694 [Lactarius deliciosus]